MAPNEKIDNELTKKKESNRAQIPARDLTWDMIPRHLSQIIVIV